MSEKHPSISEKRKKKIDLLFQFYGKKCYYCSKPLTRSTVTIDHFIPLSKGGAHLLENFRPACLDCNKGKSDSYPSIYEIQEGNDFILKRLNQFDQETSRYRNERDKLIANNLKLSESEHKQKIQTERWKKIAKHYLEVLNIVIKKFNKRTLEELIK